MLPGEKKMELLNFFKEYSKKYYEYPPELLSIVINFTGQCKIVCFWKIPNYTETLENFSSYQELIEFIENFE
jgi:hypothetical protein